MHDNPFVSGNHLRACRALAGFEQRELARKVKISDRAIRHWEARRVLPKQGVALALLANAIRERGVIITARGCDMPAPPQKHSVADSGNKIMLRTPRTAVAQS